MKTEVDGREYVIHEDTSGYAQINLSVVEIPTIRATIRYEEYAENPRKEYCHMGLMVHIPNSYDRSEFGDEQWERETLQLDCKRCKGTGEDPERYGLFKREVYGHPKVGAGTIEAMNKECDLGGDDKYYVDNDTCLVCQGDCHYESTLDAFVKEAWDAVVALPIHFADYGSSGSRAWIENQFDEDTNGVIFVSKATAQKEYGDDIDLDGLYDPEIQRQWGENPPKTPREGIERVLKGEVEEYQQWLEGEVFYYDMQNSFTGNSDACGGFIGREYAIESTVESLTEEIRAHLKEQEERANMAARDVWTEGA